MAKIFVVHMWEDNQKEAVMQFAEQVKTMASQKKLPSGLKLLSIDLAENKNMAVCQWEAPSVEILMNTAAQLKPTWKIEAFVAKNVYKKGFL